ncbi:metallophosphoesterase [Agrobacterium sp. rho-13.3]|uniref:metallophosphoesterase n=1 Tax=Agrobacterium sp. rho-13.3 TaxID=3072980 RepID=UPI002A11787D|nr:metallophosphoesterase [Agrobacterium sp. rho-13.3]MDX8311725.1 metallophosphoesterase [Agrobacterium sp. rho-13.3]
MFHLIFGLPWLVVVLRFIQPLPWILSVKIAVAVVLLVASQYHLVSRLSSGSVFSPEFPRPLIIAFNVVFGAIVLLAFFQLALDAISLIVALVNRGFPVVPPSVRYGIGVLALGLSAFGVSQAIRIPPLKNIEIAIAGLPAAFDGYRVLQLTDLHISRLFPASWAEEVVKRSNALDVDLTVITGDFIDGTLEARQVDVAPLANLRARDGVLAIPGNHEYYFGYDGWMRHDAGLGIRMLLNEHAVIERGEDRVVVAGLTDLAAMGSAFPAPDLTAALRGAPANAPVILLDHQPRMAERSAQAGVALQLSGHTHGGMIRGLDMLVARGNNGFVSGLYDVGGMQLYVNNGTGLWPGFALRLGRLSELTVITLRRPK